MPKINRNEEMETPMAVSVSAEPIGPHSRIERVKVSAGRTVSLGRGSFEFIRADVAFEAILEPEENVTLATDQLRAMAIAECERTCADMVQGVRR